MIDEDVKKYKYKYYVKCSSSLLYFFTIVVNNIFVKDKRQYAINRKHNNSYYSISNNKNESGQGHS